MQGLLRVGSLGLALALATGISAPAAAQPGTVNPRAASPYSIAPTPCPLPSIKAWECSTLSVPMDWFDMSNPDRANIAVAVHRATGERRGTLTLNPGGPGSSSILIADVLMKALPAPVTRHFDIVLWDARGVGLSTPVPTGCTTPITSPEIPETGPVDWSAVAEDFLMRAAEGNRQCYAANPDLAPYLGTQYVVRDLEALRTALGVRQWSYWGMSYGTQIGLLYAQLYPSRLRATVLDGAVQPGLTIPSAAASRGTAYQAALAMLGASIGPVHALRMNRVIRALNTRTYVDADGVEVTRTTFLETMFAAAGSQELIPDAVAMIDEAWRSLFGAPRGREAIDYGYFYARSFVLCGDTIRRDSIAEAAASAQASAAIGTVNAGSLSLQWSASCAGLAPGSRPVTRVRTPITLPTPPVIVNALGDPATPWVWAREMTSVFRGASFITYNGVGHVIYGNTPSRCVNDAVTAYLLRLSRPGDITCDYARN